MIGETLGPYRIDRELGAGGMGTVYAATVAGGAPGPGEGSRVALKVVHPHLLETADAVARFQREVEIGQTVDHPNVVRTFGGAEADGHHFLAMEYVEGQTLEELLRELDRVPEELCRHIGREVCKGLSAIHAAGAIHRDMKPENVLITPDQVVKIMDLGVARSTDDALRLSQTGAFVGSLQYAAPEQFTGGGKRLDGRVDLHGLGLVLYELATGVCPYRADDIPQTVRKVLHEEPRRLGEINPQLSAFFEEAVHCLLAKDREQRFATADELNNVLDSGEESPWWHARAQALQLETRQPIRRMRIQRETAVYGRDAEVASLRELYERAKAGDGNVVLIEGEAGIGKSRLVDELIGALQRDGEDIDFVFGSYPPGGAATASGAFATAYREQFGAAGSAPYLPENQLLVPAFDALLRGDSMPQDVESLTKDSLQTCFVRATQTMAKQRVVVVLIDDLHFAPEEGRALFTSIAMAVPGHRVLLLGTTRPGVPKEWLAGVTRLEQTSQLALQRLGPRDLVQLLEDTLQSERLAGDLSAQIAEKSDGNPFFVFEIIRGLREGQFITQKEDGSWVSTRAIEDIQIPDSVMDLIQARIADLSEEQKELLDVAACCGFAFDPRLVAEVVGLRRIPALRLLGGIEKSHRLVRSAGRGFTFDHHQVQEALYEAISGALREEYHGAIAEAMESLTNAAETEPEALDGALCVDLCEHYLKGARGEEALRYLPSAQTHLSNAYLHAQVAALGERALAVPDLLVGTERANTLLQLSAALDLMARRARQEECAREAERLAEEAGDDELRVQAATALGTCLERTSRRTEAETVLRRAVDVALARGDRRGGAIAMGILGNVFYSLGRLREAQEHQERHLALSREIGDRRGEAGATVNLGIVCWTLGRLREAQEHFERARALCREIGQRQFEANASANLGRVFASLGRPREAQEHEERSLAIKREIGDRLGQASSTGSLGSVFFSQGRLHEAQDHYERHLAMSREIGDREGEAGATGNLGNVFCRLGRLREAQEHYERLLSMSREAGSRQFEAVALLNLGGVLREEGERAPAVERLVTCLSLSEKIGHRHIFAATHLALGSLRAAAGDGGRGLESLAAARDLAAEMGAPGIETLARCELACLPGGDAADALAAFTGHEARLDASERREAQSLLFRATRDRAHLAEAKRLLDESLVNVPAEYHEAMLTNLRLNREIMAAWNAQSGTEGAAGA